MSKNLSDFSVEIAPAFFFAYSWVCPKIEERLPRTSSYKMPSNPLLQQELFADLYMGWNEKQVTLFIEAQGVFSDAKIELFFDIGNLKMKKWSKFCHYFLFDSSNTDFVLEQKHSIRSYQMKIGIPSQALKGYDPDQCPRFGFTYRIGRGAFSAQDFSVSSEHANIEDPSLWATILLKQ